MNGGMIHGQGMICAKHGAKLKSVIIRHEG